MVETPKGWRPRNIDGSEHKCDRGQSKSQKPVQNTNEHQEFEGQHASFSPAMENEIYRLIKEDLVKFLNWMASQAEGQA
jgi:hypothetical protein